MASQESLREDQENIVLSKKSPEHTTNKRMATTPLATKHQNIIRRRTSPGIGDGPNRDGSSIKYIDIPGSEKDLRSELIDAKHQIWLCNEIIKKQKATIEFLEIERKFA